MRIAYLVNQYPSLSHSFIRREILALERLGMTIFRFSIRPPAQNVIGKQDRSEAALTSVVFNAPKSELLIALLTAVMRQPAVVLRSLIDGWKMSGGGSRRLVRTLACSIEACWLARRWTVVGIDHVHAHFGTNSAAVARLAARLARIRYSFTIHGPEEFDNVDRLALPAKVADAAFTVAVSGFGRSQICRFVPTVIWPHVHVVHCGLDLAEWNAPAIANATSDLCFVGRLVPQKGLPSLVEAVALLRNRGIAARTLIIGSGPLAGELQAACAASGITDLVAFAGAQDEATVRAAMAAAKIVVVPSFAEGLPVVIMEALAANTPVISTFIAGIPELIDDRCGALVVAGDAAALADAIERLLAVGDERRSAMGAAGRARVAERHDIDQSARQLKALFEHYGRRTA